MMEKKEFNIIFISCGNYEYDGRLRELLNVARSMGNVTAFFASEKNIFLSDCVCYSTESLSGTSYVKFIAFIIQKTRGLKNIDILFVDNRKAVIPALLLKILRHPKAIIQDMRELYLCRQSSSIFSKLGCLFESIMIKCSDVLICANDERVRLVRRLFKRKKPILSYENIRRLEYSPNADIKKFEKKYKSIFDVKDSFKLIATSGCDIARGTIQLIEAIKYNSQKIDLYLVGGGTEDDIKKIDRLMEDLQLECIHKIGKVGQDELKYLIAQCDCGVVNYGASDLNNKFCASGKIYEFIFEGIPVITTTNPPLRNYCKKYGIGVSEEDYGVAINQMIENYNIYKKNAEKLSQVIDVEENNTQIRQKIMYYVRKLFEE